MIGIAKLPFLQFNHVFGDNVTASIAHIHIAAALPKLDRILMPQHGSLARIALVLKQH
jgi:hypothetical protein